jgi:hypothetical protein
LNAESAIGPAEGAIRIESSPATSVAIDERRGQVSPRRAMSERQRSNGHEPVVRPEGNGQANGDVAGKSLAALIQDAESLHATLMEARSSLARLIAGLRRHRKQSQHLSDAPRSLRQLKLGEPSEYAGADPAVVNPPRSHRGEEIFNHAHEAECRRVAQGRAPRLRVGRRELQP